MKKMIGTPWVDKNGKVYMCTGRTSRECDGPVYEMSPVGNCFLIQNVPASLLKYYGWRRAEISDIPARFTVSHSEIDEIVQAIYKIVSTEKRFYSVSVVPLDEINAVIKVRKLG